MRLRGQLTADVAEIGRSERVVRILPPAVVISFSSPGDQRCAPAVRRFYRRFLTSILSIKILL